ncbi:MAG: ATP-grasp domain-containing protein [Chloroflexi bacterium]|nr:ATP-grasp domain-containing protein [Chloroflexota bacterium]
MFNKVLVANRGEIACRIIRTLRRLGIKSVAVFSEADAKAPHVKLADEAHPIGPPPVSESYLKIDKIIALAQATGAEAIHPGYGFMSENADFAEAVARGGMVFVGPPPEALRALGKKTEARKLLPDINVPTVPWSEVSADDMDRIREVAEDIGFPVIVKASQAGGGVGATVVKSSDKLEDAVRSSVQVSERFFGTSQIHIEKYLEKARHIEVQVIIDQFGSAVAFPERDCSIQRRYQKVVEESPSVAVSPLLRRYLSEAALKVMKAGGYVNTGTVEFLVDAYNNFYFLEVNCRIQVEHPVSEMVTGVDIVEHQIRVAAGQKLNLTQNQVRARGHSIEVRIYAEDPKTFTPTVGTITKYREPTGGGIRVDSGLTANYEVTPYYDPMLAKLIVWRETREEAITAMVSALEEYTIEGMVTNMPLLSKIMQHPIFVSGEYDTASLTPQLAKSPLPSKKPIAGDLSELWKYGR